MSNRRDRRSHVLPPSRKIRRHSLATVMKNEHHPIADIDTALELLLDLPPQGRRALLDARRDRSDWRH